jgi:hypothetical protein
MRGIVEQKPYISVAKGGERYYHLYGSNRYPLEDYMDKYHIEWTTTPCHFGGKRFWLICPFCGEKKLSLFFVDGWFKCRKCGDLLYDRQRLSRSSREIDHFVIDPLKAYSEMISNNRPYYNANLTKKAQKQLQKISILNGKPKCSII